MVTENISIGLYYLYSHGLQEHGLQNAHYLSLGSSFSRIKLTNQYLLQINPQFYYLKLDSENGFYFSSSFALKKKNFALFVSAIINKKLKSNITGSKDFLWNTSIVYSFSKNYVRQ